MRLKKILLIVFIASCGSSSIEEIPETTTTTLDPELSICERVEREYISLSNQLFETSFELNDYINNKMTGNESTSPLTSNIENI